MSQTAIADILILLFAAIIAVPLFQRLKAGAILGYLMAGIVLGPSGFEFFKNIENMRHLAELGVVFLLFAIGLEMKLSRLWLARRYVFGLGSLQVGGTALILMLILWQGAGFSFEASLIAGGGLALSSTAMVLQVLMDQGEMTSRIGRLSFCILILQDLAVIPLLALVSIFGSGGEEADLRTMALATGKAIIVLGGIVLIGRFVLRHALYAIASSRSVEIFAAAAVFVVLGTSWLTAEVGLSMEMGAFLAGLLLAETEFRHQFEADILPFRSFLLGLFFMTVGMSIDLKLLINEFGLIIVCLIAFLLLKTFILTISVWFFSASRHFSLRIGLLLAQGGEFAFVLFDLAVRDHIMPSDLGNKAILVVSLSMLITPLLAKAAQWIGKHSTSSHSKIAGISTEQESDGPRNHVIIAGFGRVGQTVAQMLAASDIPYVALDLQPDRVSIGRAKNIPIYFADASRLEVYHAVGIAHARAVVITLDHMKRAEKAVSLLHRTFPQIPVFARARDRAFGKILSEAGAKVAMPETLEASLQLGALMLRSIGNPSDDVTALLDTLRENGYAALQPIIDGNQDDKRRSRGR